MDDPYYRNFAKHEPVSVETIKEALGNSPLSEHFVLARNPRINHNSASSTTFFFKILPPKGPIYIPLRAGSPVTKYKAS